MPNNNRTHSLVEVPFHNQTILAQQREGGNIYAALKPICENIGIDYEGQRQRIARQEWATTCVIKAVGADGKTREMVGVDRQTLVMWLATIDTSRIKNEKAKRLIILYQREAAKALDAYFNEGGAIRVREDDTDMDIMARAVLVAQKHMAQRDRELAEVRKQVSELAPKAEALDVFTSVEGSYSVSDAAKLLSNDLDIQIGRNRLYVFMESINWVFRDAATNAWKAYQSQVDNGRLEMKAHVEHGKHRDGTTFPYPPTVRVTAKGLDVLRGLLRRRGTGIVA